MKGISVLASFVLLTGSAVAQSGAWGQCGGIGWSGATTCVSGYYCKVTNDYYSQCIPGMASATPSSSSTRAPTPTSTTSPVVNPPASSTVSVPPANPSATGVLIRGVTNPVYHLYLQASGTTPVLGPEASAHKFAISGSMKDNSSGLYLNIEDASTSYKPLSFGATATFTGWGLEGDTIITTQGSSFGRRKKPLAPD